MISTTIGVLAISILTGILKKYIMPKFGSTGVHVLIFLLGCAYVVITTLSTSFPGFKVLVEEGLSMLALAVTAYEVLLKKLNLGL